WIGSNPGAFAKLSLWKQILFLGDDSGGVYETLRRGMNIDGIRYALPKLAMQGLWWLLLLLICQRLLETWRAGTLDLRALALVALPVLFLWVMHSVFESSGKYHVPAFGFIPLMLAVLYRAPTETRSR